MRIGFIGLGVMGGAMCANLVRRGREVVAFDLSEAALDQAVAAGARRARSAEQAAGADLLITCLPGGAEVSALLLDRGVLGAMAPGAVCVEMSTSPPDLMRRCAAAAPAGVAFADAPVARTRQAAQDGTLLIMVGADQATFARIRPVLQDMGEVVAHCGPVGAGQTAKILNNMVLFQTVAALAEAAELAEHAGMDPSRLFDVLEHGSAGSFALRNHGRKALARETYPDKAFSVRYAAKDLSYALAMGDAANIKTPGARHVAALFDQAVAAGDGDLYFPVIRNRLKAPDASD